MQHTEYATRVIVKSLNAIFKTDYSDVARVHSYSHYIESILMTFINARRIGIHGTDYTSYSAVLNQMVSLRLLSEDINAFWVVHGSVIWKVLNTDWISACDDPRSMHEELLGRDLYISGGEVWFTPGKTVRDTMGSYYTPNDLATDVIHEAIERYLRNHNVTSRSASVRLLSSAKIADLSCGCGEFIRAAQKYLYERYGIKQEESCVNFYGIDIDPIALQITICDLLEAVDCRKWTEIISHFALGNPLIHHLGDMSFSTKTRLFAARRYYAPSMGLDMNHLFGNIRFSIVVGNPPWEKVRLEERKFFKTFKPEISDMAQKNKRHNAIMTLRDQAPSCYNWYCEVADDYTRFRSIATKHPYLSKSLSGELNTYALFTELSLNLLDESGVFTLVVKSALATTPANNPFFNELVKNEHLSSICFYENTFKIFCIDSREKFCVISCTKRKHKTFEMVAGAKKVGDLHNLERTCLSADDIKTVNPFTLMMPSMSRNDDMHVLLDMHRRLPLFESVYPECRFGRLVHLTAHAHQIETEQNADNLPIYEGKFIERYDARFATFAGLPDSKKYTAKAHAKRNPAEKGWKAIPESRYFIRTAFWNRISANYPEAYMLCWRSLTSTTNTRTTISMLLPTMPTCQSIQFLQTKDKKDLLILLALFNSKPFDYLVRLKMPGLDLTQSVIRQIPVPHKSAYKEPALYGGVYQSLEQHILQRVSAILLTEPMVTQILQEASPERMQLKTIKPLEEELDDLFSLVYGLSDTESQYVKASFKS